MSKNSDEKPEDIRLQATKTIYGCSIAMMGISTILREPAIPILVIIGAALSSAVVWAFGGRQSQSPTLQIPEIQIPTPKPVETKPDTRQADALKALEDRLANLEAMDSYERQVLLEKRVAGEARANMAPPKEPVMPVAVASMPVDSPAMPVDTSPLPASRRPRQPLAQ